MKINYNSIQDIFQPQLTSTLKGPNKYFCLCCKKVLDSKQFFKSGRTNKYINGLLPHCKTCVVMAVEDTDPTTFLPLLKEIDVPYIPSEWRALVVKKDSKSGSILGKYVSKMRLNQFKKYSWVDSEKLAAAETESILSALRQETNSETEAEAKLAEMMSLSDLTPIASGQGNSSQPNLEAMYGLSPETSKYNLTIEEINTLKRTWGEDYTENQYLDLEQLFADMTGAYILQDPIAISNARMICIMTTKMKKFLDIDDIEAASKISRQLDLFIKTANLAPVQQKDRQQTTFSIAQMAFLVEQEGGFVPEFYIEKPNDKIDMLLLDMQHYTQALVSGESNLGSMVQNAATILMDYALKEEEQVEDDFESLEKDILGIFESSDQDEEEEGDENAITD